MKKMIIIALILVIGARYDLHADVTKTVGNTGADFTTLKTAFDAINANTGGVYTGVVTLQIIASTTETSSASLSAASYSSVYIYPTTTGLSISGSISNNPLIDLNGADNVTIDGRVNAAGSTVSLVISNTSTSTTTNNSTIRFTNDATYNTVKYCKIQGSTTTSDAGVLYFKNVATSTGNSNNTIDHNEITNAGGNRPRNALFSFGKSQDIPNSSNTVSNNNFYDVLNLNQNYTKAIALYTSEDAHPNNSYNTAWTISGNSFYDTQDFYNTNGGGSVYAIFVWADQGSGFNISNNYIGGNAALCSGTWTKSYGNIDFKGIWLNASQTGATNYIQGNTIKNFNYTNSGSYSWQGIYANGGDNNVSNNCIGSTTGTGSIVFTTGASGGGFVGITQGVYCASTYDNNTIGSITVATSNPAYSTYFIGMWISSTCGTGTISNNLIGSTTTANSINISSASTSNAQTVEGMRLQGNNTHNITNNTVANLTNGTTNSTTSTQGYIYGIWAFQGRNTMTGNTVHDLTIANANNLSGPDVNSSSLSAGGIVMSSTWGVAQTMSGNTVYNISNTNSSFAGHVTGLYYNGGDAASSVYGNLVYGLSVNASSSSAVINGIRIAKGNATFYNNIVTLGENTTTNLYGIYEAGASGTSNIYYNTVYLIGNPSSGSLNSACMYNAGGSTTRNFRNNIFNNARSGNGTHYAIYLSSVPSTIDYNDYYTSGTGGVLGYYGSDKTTIAAWRTATGQDVNSSSTLPGFQNPGGTAATSYIPSALLPAVTGTGITTDYAGSTRSGSPEMGAYERDATVIWTGGTSTDWNTGSNWNSGGVPTAGLNVIIGSGTYQPNVYGDISSPTTCNNLTIQAGCSLTIGAGKALTVNGTLTNSAGNTGLLINSDASGTGSLLQSSSSVGATIQRYVTGSSTLTDNVYHFVSIPVNYGSPTSNLFLDSYLYRMDPTILNSSNYYGDWVNMGVSTTNPLSCGSGYMIYYPGASKTYTFSGNLNSGTFTATVSYTSAIYTFNLVPNPFPSAINWGAASGWGKGSIGSTAWIWNGGNYTTVSDISNNIIPEGQAFIVMASNGSPTLTMTNSVCVHNTQAFYKSDLANVLRISANSNNFYDETFVGFNPLAGPEFDPQIDGFKLWGLEEAPQLWTEKGDKRLSIHQQPAPYCGLVIPMDFKTTYDGQVTLRFSGAGSFDPPLPVRLKDHVTGSFIDLKQDSVYVFTHHPANDEKRFSLLFGYPQSIGETNNDLSKIWISGERVFIDPNAFKGEEAKLELFDLPGRCIYSSFICTDRILSVKPGVEGMVIVRLTVNGKAYTTRGFIRR
jgi:hypothetical protein